MDVEFRIQHPLQRGLHQLLHQAVQVFHRPGLTGDFLSQLFHTIRQRSIHAPVSLVWLKRAKHVISHFAY
jgi:hypothetical protein